MNKMSKWNVKLGSVKVRYLCRHTSQWYVLPSEPPRKAQYIHLNIIFS